MVDLASECDIVTIPKVELHVHLNGAITEATAATLARRHGADPDREMILVDGREQYAERLVSPRTTHLAPYPVRNSAPVMAADSHAS